jgi:hypothetical protein
VNATFQEKIQMQKYLVASAITLLCGGALAAQSTQTTQPQTADKEACAQYQAAKKEAKQVELKEGVDCSEKKPTKTKRPLHDHGKVHKNQ